MRFVSDTDSTMRRRKVVFKFRCLTSPSIELIATLMDDGGARGDESGHS